MCCVRFKEFSLVNEFQNYILWLQLLLIMYYFCLYLVRCLSLNSLEEIRWTFSFIYVRLRSMPKILLNISHNLLVQKEKEIV